MLILKRHFSCKANDLGSYTDIHCVSSRTGCEKETTSSECWAWTASSMRVVASSN